jgi:hypothetical protein
VNSHELPHNSKHQLFVTLLDITCTNTNQFDFKFTTGIEGNLTVDGLLEGVVWILFNSIPLDNSWVDFVDNFQQNLTITDILEQVVNVDIFNFE